MDHHISDQWEEAVVGMERSLAAAGKAWQIEAVGVVAMLARRGTPFTVKDIWAHLKPPVGASCAALGAVLTRMKTAGIIRKTERLVPGRGMVARNVEWVRA